MLIRAARLLISASQQVLDVFLDAAPVMRIPAEGDQHSWLIAIMIPA